MLAFRHRNPNRHFLVHQHRLFQRLDVDELEQLEPIQLPLAFPHLPAGEPIAGLECQLAADHMLVNAGKSPDVDFAELRQHPRHSLERHRATPGTSLRFDQRHLGVGVAFVAKDVGGPVTQSRAGDRAGGQAGAAGLLNARCWSAERTVNP